MNLNLNLNLSSLVQLYYCIINIIYIGILLYIYTYYRNMKPYNGHKMKTILNPNLPWRREDETRCSAKSINVLPTKHHLTSVQNSCQTRVYTMLKHEVRRSYACHTHHSSFEFQGAKIFNSLLKSIRELKDRKQFRHAVQRYSCCTNF